jgi:diaminohydroxyphosphoribosylaminopyrimidine deaminase / 5-amino-6-(5-phosphoribosylamino)uracil reductase
MHEQFLLAALDQAWLGRGLCAPNPSVGAVAVHAGQIIAQAWHRGAGTPHAEQLLLNDLPKTISDVTLYVTLEPCNHWGKTPPCVEAIIKHGIKKVVYAYRDPNPVIVANNTPRILSEQGIEVLHYPLAVIDEFYRSYRYWTLTNKPWVTVKIAQTLDGKIAGAEGERAYISNALCEKFTHEKRMQSDIILTTAKTINLDDPLLNIRLPGVEVTKCLAIIDGKGTLNPNARVFTTAKHSHIYYDEQYINPGSHSNRTYHAIPSKHGLLDLGVIIHHLGELGYHDVWVEAGPRLFNALHAARLVNKTYIYIAPTILGEAAISNYQHADIFNQACKVTWNVMEDNVIACLDWMVDI